MPNFRGRAGGRGGKAKVGGGAVIKCFRGKIVGNFAQNLQNDPLLQLGTKW